MLDQQYPSLRSSHPVIQGCFEQVYFVPVLLFDYLPLNQEDFFVSELAKIKKACKPSNAETWAKNIFERLWLPMKVFEKEKNCRFSWLHYYVLINDIQMKTNLS